MSTHLGTKGRLLAAPSGIVLSFGGTVTAPVVLPTPDAPVITAEDDAAQTLTFSLSAGLSYDQVRYEVAGAGPYIPTGFTIQLSPTTSYLPGAVVLYVGSIDGMRNESQRAANSTTLAAYVPPANTNPAAPSLDADDNADTLTVISAYPLAELEQRITDSGAVTALAALVTQVGDVDRPEGYYQVRVKAASGRNQSNWSRSAAFTKKPVNSGGPPAGYTGHTVALGLLSPDNKAYHTYDPTFFNDNRGDWRPFMAVGGAMRYLDPGVSGTVKANWWGRVIEIRHTHQNLRNRYDVWLDGSFFQSIDQPASPAPPSVFITASAAGSHTIELRTYDYYSAYLLFEGFKVSE